MTHGKYGTPGFFRGCWWSHLASSYFVEPTHRIRQSFFENFSSHTSLMATRNPRKNNQLRLVVYPVIDRVLSPMPGGWPWDFWTINSSSHLKTFHANLKKPEIKLNLERLDRGKSYVKGGIIGSYVSSWEFLLLMEEVLNNHLGFIKPVVNNEISTTFPSTGLF